MKGLSSKQLEFVRAATTDDNAKYLLVQGSVGSGKSTVCALAWAVWMASSKPKPGGVTVFAARTQASGYDNIVRAFKNPDIFGDLADTVKVSQGQSAFKIFGHEVVMVSASDATAKEKLKGKNVVAVLADEVVTFEMGFFTELTKRLRWGSNTKMFASFNPSSPNHWLKKKYIDRLYDNGNSVPLYDLGWRHFVMTFDDNPGLSEEYKENLRNTLVGADYDRDVLGQWSASSDRIFKHFSESRHVIRELPPIERYLAVGFDYGDSAFSSAVVIGQTFDGKLVVVDEFGYSAKKEGNRQLAPSELASLFIEWLNTLDGVPDYIFVDPGGGGAGFMKQLLVDPNITPWYGAVGQAKKGAGSIITGIGYVKSLMAQDRLLVHARCENLIREFFAYSWDTEASERKNEDVPLSDGNDHFVDALRYALIETRPLWAFSDIDLELGE